MDWIRISALLSSISMAASFMYMLSDIEPYCYYFPGALKKYYTVHKNITTKFSDIIGCDDIKKELFACIQNGVNYSKGCIFYGPSGTGKTMMARAIAGESSLPFIEVFTNDIQASYIPKVLEKIIHRHSPCIIFIDECSNIINTYSDTLLRKIDGLVESSMKNVFLILATDKQLPKNIYRSGRIDKYIQFSKPGYTDRLKMFESLKNKHPELNIEPDIMAKKTDGFTHSDISIIPREINLKSNIENNNFDNKIMENVFNDIRFGKFTQKATMTENQISRITYHEIGHTIISYAINNKNTSNECAMAQNDKENTVTIVNIGNKPNKITIDPCGNLLGHTSFNSEDMVLLTKSDIINKIMMLLASNVFETYFCHEPSTSFSHDYGTIMILFNEMKKSYMVNLLSYKEEIKFVNTMLTSMTKIINNFIASP